MILHQPEIDRVGDDVCVSSHVETRLRLDYLPLRLRYRIPVRFSHSLSRRGDPFLVSLLLLAMNLGEDVDVRGAVSPKLLEGLKAFQGHFHRWSPSRFKIVTVRAEQVEPPRRDDDQSGEMMAFSGGLDSFYTLWCATHLRLGHPLRIPLTLAFVAHGFDIPLDCEGAYRRVWRKFEPLFMDLRIELIPIRTNVRLFSQLRINWLHMYGPALVGAALSLGGMADRLYISGANLYLGTRPLCSPYFSDPWLSTESLEVVHHGGGISRLDKMDVIADWPVTHDRLLVCSQENRVGIHNCGRCEKCLRMMAGLEVTGHSGTFTTLPERISARDFIGWALVRKSKFEFSLAILRRAWQTRRYGIWLWMLLVIGLGALRSWIHDLALRALPDRARFRLKVIAFGLKEDPIEGKQSRPCE